MKKLFKISLIALALVAGAQAAHAGNCNTSLIERIMEHQSLYGN